MSCVDAHALVCHEPRTNVDLHKTLVDHTFCFDRVFGEGSATADVYAAMVVLAPDESFIKCPSTLNVLKDTYM